MGTLDGTPLSVGSSRLGGGGEEGLHQALKCPVSVLLHSGMGEGVEMEGKGRLSFVNSEQNNRIKEMGLKGSQSRWPWLQAGPGHFLRPWEGWPWPPLWAWTGWSGNLLSCALGPYVCLVG